MRTTVLALSAAAVLTSCGGDRNAGGSNAAAPSSAAAPANSTSTAAATTPGAAGGTATAATGKTTDVKMIGDAQGYRFEPVNVTIKAGDAVRWTNVSGGPHNVTFWADSIPGGAQAQLAPNMPNTTEPLAGPLLTDPNATYAVSFAGLKPGVYHYYCTPHLALGMKATVTVQ